MKRTISFLLILLLTHLTFASYILKGRNISVEVFKGWEMLDPNEEYVLQLANPYKKEYIEFMETQRLIYENFGKTPLCGATLKEQFESIYSPLVLIATVLTNSQESIVVEFFSTNSEIYKFGDFHTWVPKRLKAIEDISVNYYWVEIPPRLSYTCFFLLPNALIDSDFSLSFLAPRGTKFIAGDDDTSIDSRIENLKREIERLETLK